MDRGSTGSGGSVDPHFLECGVKSMLFDPHFFMHKSMVVCLLKLKLLPPAVRFQC